MRKKLENKTILGFGKDMENGNFMQCVVSAVTILEVDLAVVSQSGNDHRTPSNPVSGCLALSNSQKGPWGHVYKDAHGSAIGGNWA